MPLYEYKKDRNEKGCPACAQGFTLLEGVHEAPRARCEKCGAKVHRIISRVHTGGPLTSRRSLDSRAKEKGFHKLKRVDKGTFEKIY